MPRFTRQYQANDCGPVALLNIMKWLGWNLTYKNHIEELKIACKYKNTDTFIGVKWWNIARALRKLTANKVQARAYEVTNLGALERHVKQGGAFILRYHIVNGLMHYATVVPGKNGKFKWINGFADPSPRELSPEEFESEIMATQVFGSKIIGLLITKSRVEGSRKYNGPGTGRKRKQQK